MKRSQVKREKSKITEEWSHSEAETTPVKIDQSRLNDNVSELQTSRPLPSEYLSMILKVCVKAEVDIHARCAWWRDIGPFAHSHPTHTRAVLSDTPSLSWIIQKLLSPNSSNSYSFICIPAVLQNDWPAITNGKKKTKNEGNVPQTICFKMRREWFCSFQWQRQAPVHNDVSVMGWQIDWRTMTLAWETHQWAATQLWSQRALRHTLWTLFVSQPYEPDKWRHATFYA